MNTLSSLYSDDYYQAYTDIDPRFCVAVLSTRVEDAEKVSQVLRQVCPRLIAVSQTKMVRTLQKPAFTPSNTFRFLRSNWCFKHQTSVYSCAVLVCFVDNLAADASPALIADDLMQRLGTVPDALSHAVAFAPYSDHAVNPQTVFCGEVEKCLRTALGARFVGSALQTDQDSVWRGIAALQKLVVEACVAYHKNEVRRLRERRDAISTDVDRERLLPRLFFKLGWHYLVLHDFSNARRQMLSGLRKLKGMFPLFPSFQSRLCGSVFLWQFLSCVSLCGGRLNASSEVYREIRRYVDWIGSAYGGSVHDECQTITSVLTKLLEAEWLEYLVRKTENLDISRSCDYLVAAAQALQDCVAFFPSRCDGGSVGAPPHIGEEEMLGEHAELLWKRCDKSAVRGRIVRLLSEAKSQRCSREAEVNYLTFLASSDFLDSKPELTLIEQIVAKSNGPILSRLSEVACGAVNTWKAVSPALTAALLLNGSVDSVNYAEQEKYRHRLLELNGCLEADEVLEYPRGCLAAPFTAIAYFAESAARVVGDCASVVVVLFTTSTKAIAVDVHTLTFSSSCGDDAASDADVPLSPPQHVELSAAAPRKVVVSVPLSRAGRFACSSVTATVQVSGFAARVRWRFAAGNALSAHPVGRRAREAFFAQNSRTVLDVSNPSTILKVECPSFIQAVEGECAECEIYVSCAALAVRECSMTIPYEPKLFRAMCWSSANEPLPAAEASGEVHFTLPDLLPNTGFHMVLSLGCMRSFEIRLPVTFRCSTDRYGEITYSRALHLSVDPPFNVEHSLLGSSSWSAPNAGLAFPTVSPSFVQYDKSVLVKAADVFSSPLITNWKDDCALYFFTKEPSPGTFVFPAHDIITLSCTFRCTAKRGLTVLGTEVIVSDDVELLACCGNAQQSFLEEGECATSVTRFRAKTPGQHRPGFIRVHFSPQHSTARLYSDVCMPAIEIEASAVEVSVRYPQIASCASAFALEVTVCNTAQTPFIGELVLETEASDFACEAAGRRTLQVGPGGKDVVRCVVTPLRAGELVLPRFQIRSTATLRTVADSDACYVVHVLPAGQNALEAVRT